MAISKNTDRRNHAGVVLKGITSGCMLKIDAERAIGERTYNSRRGD
jgi:hypothetical protein